MLDRLLRLLLITTLLLSGVSGAYADCFDDAAAFHRVNPTVLRAIAIVESGGKASAVNHNGTICVYEAIHGGPREVIGADRANPLPLLMPALEMLNDLGHGTAAQRIRAAVESVLKAKTALPLDLGGSAGTQVMAEAIIAAL